MSHHNAVLTPRGRLRLVQLVHEQGLTFRQAAACLGVSVATAWEWVRRWRGATLDERQGLVCLHDRSSAPHRQPRLFDALTQARIVLARRRTGWGSRLIAGELEMAHQSVWKVLKRHGFSRTGWGPRLIAGELEMAHQSVWKVLKRHGFSRIARAPRESARRYEWPCPGDLLHIDTKRSARFTPPGHAVTGVRDRSSDEKYARVGYQFAHAIVDDHSRLAYVELHDDERAGTVTAFVVRALSWFAARGVITRRVMTDG